MAEKLTRSMLTKLWLRCLCPLPFCAHASVIKSKDKVCKYMMVLIGHTAVVTQLVIEFSATSWITSISNGGGSCARCVSMGEEHATIMEVEVCI
jgi:hypothetical protein